MADSNFTITQDFLKSFFHYEDGRLFYTQPSGRMTIGDRAGTVNGSGYYQTCIKGKIYKNHRLIFLMHHGYLPKEIDHIDGNPRNNRIENLREATHTQNSMNHKLSKANKSGFKGVNWCNTTNKWRATCRAFGKKHHVGHFVNIEDAVKALESFRKLNHGNFANNGN